MNRRTGVAIGAAIAGIVIVGGIAVAMSGNDKSSPTTFAFPDDQIDADAVTSAPPVAASPQPASAAPACRQGDPLTNVYHRDRLEIINPCMTVSGVVVSSRTEQDGDSHIDIRLDTPFANLVNDRNRALQEGYLVIEIIPADKAGCSLGQPPRPAVGTYDFGICTGAAVKPPRKGQHVDVTGPYVLDHHHGWMEIHPVWSIAVTRPGAPR